ncbi:ComC/BlpC family peptide pheromone/bacteriocin [Streptococcus halichoeri]|uniref:ComC/BlpC family peptide pheromone/bacteriocin n=1 Tax=Streptococcus halichoeri TaxID=254785 RepID=UPI0019172093|nr:ComC/BlpC family peptide pheromone/bacteriocin [Streptococcus halichoeri]
MNTLEDYSVLNSAQLIEVKGGRKVNWGKVGSCAAGIAFGAGEGYMATAGGTAFLGPYAFGTGAIGAVIGGVGGALTC